MSIDDTYNLQVDTNKKQICAWKRWIEPFSFVWTGIPVFFENE